ncbi:hypothetical protein DH09_04920 [Bacillaceae bacterium JMAK1]|nr:hypothetical protein DH09_04920 [Bacillaceae bacterium JMAK1]
MSQNIQTAVSEITEPILQELGMELVDIEYKKEGKNWFLRLFIDHPDGIGLDECSLVSERVSEVLDREDPIEGFYYLEVSSPGAERPLKKDKDFVEAVGKNVYVKTYEQLDGQKEFEGNLISYESETLTIEIRVKAQKKTITIPREKIATARLSVL